jgi:acetyl-CoA carboxylase carboxyl transferase subunit beta
MEWFQNSKSGIESGVRRDTPSDLWVKCENCKEVVYKSDWAQALNVCPACGHHHRFTAREYIALLTDEGTFKEEDGNVSPADPLKFSAKKKYRDSVLSAQKTTGEKSAVVSGTGAMNGQDVSLAVMDFRFMGGSMGSAEGEKIARALQRALDRKIPAIVISASGGARMHEGTLSLLQMAKTSAVIGRLREAGVPYISLLTNPTTGGVTASFAMLGDANISEPGALIGFAGERVIRETIRQALPDGFQRAEFLLKHGFLDAVVARKDLKSWISSFLSLLTEKVA